MKPLPETLALASREGRLCPKPAAWQRMYELLPGTRRDSYGSIPPEPFILAAWDLSTDEQKQHRLVEHLEWAHKHGALDAVHAFLGALAEAEWHHVGD